MRVALITDGIWPYVLGGMQKHSYYLCKYLAKSKVHVDLVHFNDSRYKVETLEFFSAEEKQYIRSILVDFPTTAKFPGHYLYRSYLHSKLVFEAIKDQLNTYDLIYTKGFTGWYLIDQKQKYGVTTAPIAVKFHGYEMFQKPPDLKTKLQHVFLLRGPVRRISQKADLVFSYGGKVTDIIRSIGVEEKRIVELPSGVEEETLAKEIRPVAGKIKFLFLGRYERRKGIEELNAAINDLIGTSSMDQIEFHFVGPIPDTKKVKHPRVTYHGEIRDKTQLQQVIKTCDVLLCPSWSEGMPNVIMEAMANGLAVVATNVGANNVLVNGQTGWLLEQGSGEAIKQCIAAIVATDTKIIDEKKRKALDHMRADFTWEKLILRFCDKVLKKRS